MNGIDGGPKKSTVERRYVKFGKFVLNHFQLNKNKLLVKYPGSMGPVPKIRGTIITNDFKSLMQDLLDTHRINTAIQKKLSKSEAEMFGLLIRLAGLTEQLDYKEREMSIDDYIHRFDILRGELQAGNDSKIMKEELIELIGILNKAGKINDNDSKEFIELLK